MFAMYACTPQMSLDDHRILQIISKLLSFAGHHDMQKNLTREIPLGYNDVSDLEI